MDHQEAKLICAAHYDPLNGNSLPGKGTRLFALPGDRYVVRVYDVDVVTYNPDGTVLIDSGGWHTQHMAAKINQYAPVACWIRDGVLHVGHKNPDLREGTERRLDFLVRVDEEGRPLS